MTAVDPLTLAVIQAGLQQVDATTVIEPGAVATVDPIGNLRIAVGGLQ